MPVNSDICYSYKSEHRSEGNYFFGLRAESASKKKNLTMTLPELLRQLVLKNKSTEAMLMSGLSYILC